MSPDADRPLLEVDGLTIEIPVGEGAAPRAVVRGLSFAIGAGEIVGLVGESGAGKSLTALALVGLTPPVARIDGRIRFAGRPLGGLSERQWNEVRGAGIGFVFQEPLSALNPVMSLGAQVVETIRAHRPASRAEARARTVRLLGSLSMPDPEQSFDAFPHQLSGGQRQRAMIAIAIAAEPRLLVADEPTTALDAILQTQILGELARLRRELGLAILLISHDLPAVAGTCDRGLVLDHGELVESGSFPALFEAPRHALTRELVQSQPRSAAPA